MRNNLFLTAIAAVITLFVASATALAQAGTAITITKPAAPAPAPASPSGPAACPVEVNDSGTYGGPVNVVLDAVAGVQRFDLHFHAVADGPALVEAQLPNPDTHRAVFRVSRSYEAVRVYGIGQDGREVLCESNLSYTITGRPRPRPAVRQPAARKAAAQPAKVAPVQDLEEEEPSWAIRLGEIVVEQGGIRRRLSLAQRRVDDETVICTGQDADSDGRGDRCRTTTDTGWTPLADARDVMEGDRRAEQRAVDQSRGYTAGAVAAHEAQQHRSAGAVARGIGAWAGIGTIGGAVVCGLASAATGGLAAGFCIPALAIGSGGGAVIGVADAAVR